MPDPRGAGLFRATVVVLAAGFAMTVGFMLHAGSPGDPGWWAFFFPFAAWLLAPYGGAFMVARRVRNSALAAGFVTVSGVLAAAFAAWALVDAFLVNPDPQSGLILLVIPPVQVLLMAPPAVAALWLSARRRRKQMA